MPASVLLTAVLTVGHFSVKRRFINFAEAKLPANMQTQITAPATGIETIELLGGLAAQGGRSMDIKNHANSSRCSCLPPFLLVGPRPKG